MPGITRNPVKGQDENIEETIKNMILKYITHQEAVILVRLRNVAMVIFLSYLTSTVFLIVSRISVLPMSIFLHAKQSNCLVKLTKKALGQLVFVRRLMRRLD